MAKKQYDKQITVTYYYENRNHQDWLHYIRRIELNKALKFFPKKKDLNVLEIGGGDGFIASLLSENGYQVTSIDLEPRFPQHYEVQKATDSKLPFSDATFDLVFSSNVLEHVTDLKMLFCELKRVTRPDALMVHVMPSPAWRMITSFWHYTLLPYTLVKIVVSKLGLRSRGSENRVIKHTDVDTKVSVTQRNLLAIIKKLLLDPHGEYPSCFHEVIHYSQRYWRKVFINNGFKEVVATNCPLFYSGKSMFTFRFIKLRAGLARLNLHSCSIYAIKL